MAAEILPVGQYKPGFTLGANGHLCGAYDLMAEKIPQLHALLTILTEEEWTWNDEIKSQLIYLSVGVAKDIHEAFEKDVHEGIAKREKSLSPVL